MTELCGPAVTGRRPSPPTDDRATWDNALRAARLAAYQPGEFVGQESFMTATEIRTIASRAGIGAGTRVLDLCCGVAGPGGLIARELACHYVGVDASRGAVELARQRTESLCQFHVSSAPAVPAGPFDVVLVLETMLAFAQKGPLLASVASVLAVGGRFAFTLEEAEPLTAVERAHMPAPDTVWPVPLPELARSLEAVGLRVRWHADWTASHHATASSLLAAFEADAGRLVARLGTHVVADLLTAHRLWSEWLAARRVRKLAVVAEKVR